MPDMQLDLPLTADPAAENLGRLRLAAQITGYLTWPDDMLTRDAYLREPYLT